MWVVSGGFFGASGRERTCKNGYESSQWLLFPGYDVIRFIISDKVVGIVVTIDGYKVYKSPI